MKMAITRFIHEGKIHNCTKTKFCKKDTEKDSCKTYTLGSLIWKKHTPESEGKNCIGACETRGCQRSTSDW